MYVHILVWVHVFTLLVCMYVFVYLCRHTFMYMYLACVLHVCMLCADYTGWRMMYIVQDCMLLIMKLFRP